MFKSKQIHEQRHDLILLLYLLYPKSDFEGLDLLLKHHTVDINVMSLEEFTPLIHAIRTLVEANANLELRVTVRL